MQSLIIKKVPSWGNQGGERKEEWKRQIKTKTLGGSINWTRNIVLRNFNLARLILIFILRIEWNYSVLALSYLSSIVFFFFIFGFFFLCGFLAKWFFFYFWGWNSIFFLQLIREGPAEKGLEQGKGRLFLMSFGFQQLRHDWLLSPGGMFLFGFWFYRVFCVFFVVSNPSLHNFLYVDVLS